MLRPPIRPARIPLFVAVLLGTLPVPAAAQEYYNILLPAVEAERRLRSEPFRIGDWRGSRAEGDRTQRALLIFPDSTVIAAKWAIAPSGGGQTFNNEPRYEAAAYEIQKLFLDEHYYVVPPTVLRAVPLDLTREQIPGARATFREAPRSVLVALQYWLIGTTQQGYWDPQRARTDDRYAVHIGNFNILTYLIRHVDANVGNFLISDALDNPRVFSVDNGVAFNSPESNRGAMWRDMQVKRLPRQTAERLRAITREDLERVLGVLAEYEIRDGLLVAVPPGPNMSPGRGIRRSAERIQLGLSTREIQGVETRLRQLLRQVDGRHLTLF
jgi:hypothetical protein